MNRPRCRSNLARWGLIFTAFTLTSCQLVPALHFPHLGPQLLAPDGRLHTAEATHAQRRPDGTLLINDQPFFPLGFYHISWARQGTPEDRLRALGQLSHAGFNLMITDLINDDDSSSFGSTLDFAREEGVFVIPFGMASDMRERIKQHPALLGFKVADDANDQLTPQQVSEKNAEFKASYPDKLTYLSLVVANDRPETDYFGTADLIGNQSYPVGMDNIAVTYQVMRSTVTSAQVNGRVPIATLQSFAWTNRQDPPNPAEVRNMTYQALMAGVKGIVYYAYRSQEVDLISEPVLWRALRDIAQEVALLSPLLLNGKFTILQEDPGGPLAAYLSGEGHNGEMQGYLVALNTSRQQKQTVNVTLPEAPQIWDMVGDSTSALHRTGPQVSGTLRPLEVTVVQVR
ncbi:hypothetical protein [Deinococcus radiophilus]|uniref:Glycoside hydrolase family 42 N-terminal domain-containing protein n=1 Tax=Deinococcus radiophilus TaxID=32062 RepID=A0A431VUC1_9DEIO|nr:hypothetical protein [Deinococcus radiophilus]RTR26856.1 hypothetical protein EJ104_07620 [Deinococcus radiophilus]UFA51778.1 hypothetical protein LMT64_13070 [Deinococcus radiophilus]